MPPAARDARPGQESVWDYPRPPRVERSGEEVVVVLGGEVVARTRSALRVLETSHPPAYYLPYASFVEGRWCRWRDDVLRVQGHGVVLRRGRRWTTGGPRRLDLPAALPGYEAILDHVAVMPGRMDRCTVDGEVVVPQAGGFYGGWITPASSARSRADPERQAGRRDERIPRRWRSGGWSAGRSASPPTTTSSWSTSPSPLDEGELLVRNTFLSVDPYMRGG